MNLLEEIPLGLVALWAYTFVGRVWAGHVAYSESSHPSTGDWQWGIGCGVFWPVTVTIAALIMLATHAVNHAPTVGAERKSLRQQERDRLAKLAKKVEKEMDKPTQKQLPAPPPPPPPPPTDEELDYDLDY